MTATPPLEIATRIETIESAYEFMLAYAAQGRTGSEQAGSSQVRQFLVDLESALDGLAATAAESLETNGDMSEADFNFVDVIEDDARKARAAVRIVLGQDAISSQLIDNLNACVHVRAMLTDLFLLDEVLVSRKAKG